MGPLRCLLISALLLSPLVGESFSFYSTLRAGRPAAADWQIGVGITGSASDSTRNFSYNAPTNQFWRAGGLDQNFQIGWNATTNTAYTTVFNSNGIAVTSSIVKSGTQLSNSAIWTLPDANFFASASSLNQPSSIQLSNLTLAPGVQVLSGSLPTGLSASQSANGSSGFSSLNAPLVINPASTGGSWYISGSIRFNGLITQGGVAQNSQLQFFLRATGTDTPESASFALVASGIIAIVFLRRENSSSIRSCLGVIKKHA